VTRIPGADHIAKALSVLMNVWDSVVLGRSQRAEVGSVCHLDINDYPDDEDLAISLASKPGDLAVLTCSSVIQVARSVGALFAVSDTWTLTMGHLPLVRSVLEGVGQVSWLLLGDAPLSGDVPVGPEARRARAARATLLWSECLRQSIHDYKHQGEAESAELARAQLTDWEATARRAFGDLKAPNEGRWSIGSLTIPTYTAQADRGVKLAWWPNAPRGTLYPWLSAASHHRIYPLLNSLVAARIDDAPVHQVAPEPTEVTAGGLTVVRALMGMCDVTAVYLGWPSDGFHEANASIAALQQLIHGGEGDP
jgi:hypothetical protein